MIVFDDSFQHSATFIDKASLTNTMPRIVLLLDFWHPEVTKEEKEILLDLLKPLEPEWQTLSQ